MLFFKHLCVCIYIYIYNIMCDDTQDSDVTGVTSQTWDCDVTDMGL